jgi:hypothetical protein
MRPTLRTWGVAGVVAAGALLGAGASDARAQFFVSTPGFSMGVGAAPVMPAPVVAYPGVPYPPVVGAYGGVVYPGAAVGVYPVVRPVPYVYRPPVVYGPRPFYGPPYPYRRW